MGMPLAKETERYEWSSENGRKEWWAQPVVATHALNRSAGVSYSNVFRGRSFN